MKINQYLYCHVGIVLHPVYKFQDVDYCAIFVDCHVVTGSRHVILWS